MSQQLVLTDPDAPAGESCRSNGKPCESCGGSLTGRQERFCSDRCRVRWWDSQHPRVNVVPEGREGSILESVLALLADGEWRTAHQIAEEVRAFPHSVSARIAEARKRGHRIESDAVNGNSRRAHRFRLVR